MLNCPFCGASETARLEIEGARFLVFGCMFTPRIEPGLSDEEIADRLRAAVGSDSNRHFQGTCDALHMYVTKGAGAQFLTGSTAGGSRPSPETPGKTS